MATVRGQINPMEISAESVGSLNPIVSENMIEVFRQRMQSE
jgi:hypothetical protein